MKRDWFGWGVLGTALVFAGAAAVAIYTFPAAQRRRYEALGDKLERAIDRLTGARR